MLLLIKEHRKSLFYSKNSQMWRYGCYLWLKGSLIWSQLSQVNLVMFHYLNAHSLRPADSHRGTHSKKVTVYEWEDKHLKQFTGSPVMAINPSLFIWKVHIMAFYDDVIYWHGHICDTAMKWKGGFNTSCLVCSHSHKHLYVFTGKSIVG